MTGPAITALITASVSLLLAVGKIMWDLYEKRRDRRLAARELLDRYRAPLLAAVDDLGRRINNIRNDEFLAYLASDARREMAIMSTLFRFAQYLAWSEIVYGFADRLRFERDTATKAVATAVGAVGWTLAADRFDRLDPDDFTTSRLMLWREEQRAIGELMRRTGDDPGCISFATFARAYDESFSQWFAEFAADLEHPSAAKAARLAALHREAAKLVEELDVDGVLVERDKNGDIVNPRWARPSHVETPTGQADALGRS